MIGVSKLGRSAPECRGALWRLSRAGEFNESGDTGLIVVQDCRCWADIAERRRRRRRLWRRSGAERHSVGASGCTESRPTIQNFAAFPGHGLMVRHHRRLTSSSSQSQNSSEQKLRENHSPSSLRWLTGLVTEGC